MEIGLSCPALVTERRSWADLALLALGAASSLLLPFAPVPSQALGWILAMREGRLSMQDPPGLELKAWGGCRQTQGIAAT